VRYAELGQFDDAWRCIGEAMTAVETTKEKWCESDILRMAGEIALMSPQPEAAKAEAYFERALAVARTQQAKPASVPLLEAKVEAVAQSYTESG
jgi:hypothetical protein